MMALLGIWLAIPEGTVTHQEGGHLDQVLSNTDMTIDLLPFTEGTDHTGLQITADINIGETDVNLRHMPRVVTQE